MRQALFDALNDPSLTQDAIAYIRREKARVLACLETSRYVSYAYPSESNFLCIEWKDATVARERIRGAGIRVRDFDGMSRVTISAEKENDAFLHAVGARAHVRQ